MQFVLERVESEIAKYSSVSQVEVYLLNKSLSAWLTVHPSLCAVLAGEGGDSQVQLRVPGGGVPVEQVSLLMVDCVPRFVQFLLERVESQVEVYLLNKSLSSWLTVSLSLCSSCWRGWR